MQLNKNQIKPRFEEYFVFSNFLASCRKSYSVVGPQRSLVGPRGDRHKSLPGCLFLVLCRFSLCNHIFLE